MRVASFILYPPVFILLLLLASCSPESDEEKIAAVIDRLVQGLDDHDSVAVAALYKGGRIEPVYIGDSSVIYRLLYTSGGSDFDASEVKSVITEDIARASFHISGDVRRNDSVVGTMIFPLYVDLERVGSEWKIVR